MNRWALLWTLLCFAGMAHAQAIVPWDCASQDDDTQALRDAITTVQANPGVGGIVQVPLSISSACKITECGVDLKSAYLRGYGTRLSKIHVALNSACPAALYRSAGSAGGASYGEFAQLAIYSVGTVAPDVMFDLQGNPGDANFRVYDVNFQGCGRDCLQVQNPLNFTIGGAGQVRCDDVGTGYCVRAKIPPTANGNRLTLRGGTMTTTQAGRNPKGVLGLDWTGGAPSNAGVVTLEDWTVELNNWSAGPYGVVRIESNGSGVADVAGIRLVNVTAKEDANPHLPNDYLVYVDSPTPLDVFYLLENVRTGGFQGVGGGNFSAVSSNHPVSGKIMLATNAAAQFGAVTIAPGSGVTQALRYLVTGEPNSRWWFDHRSWRIFDSATNTLVFGRFNTGVWSLNGGTLSVPSGFAPLHGTAASLPPAAGFQEGVEYIILDAQPGNNSCMASNGGSNCRLLCVKNNTWKPLSPTTCQ